MLESKVEFIISGGKHCSPEQVTKEIGMTPDVVWRIGEQVNKTIMKRKENAWILSMDYSNNIDISELVESMLERIRPVKEKVVNFINTQEDVETQVCVVSYVSDQSPALNFSSHIISELSSLRVSLDVDIILQE